MSMITIPDIIKDFENQMIRNDRYNSMGYLIGNEPAYPMMINFFGEDAIKGYEKLAGWIFDRWPSFQNELLFLAVTDDGGPKINELKLGDNGISSESLDDELLSRRVSSLYDISSHFKNKSRLMLFNIIDTSGLTKIEDFTNLVTLTESFRSKAVDRSIDALELDVILLNESIGSHQALAYEIRKELHKSRGNKDRSLMILSNKRSDHSIVGNWDLYYRIIAGVIELANNPEDAVTRVLFQEGNTVFTASYTCEEKPIDQIGQVIVTRLINRIAQEENTSRSINSNFLYEPDTRKKLGFTEDGTLALLNSYSEQLYEQLPTAEQLEFFPRNTYSNNQPYIYKMSEDEVNSLTMNSWDRYLTEIILRVTKEVENNASLRENWQKQYSELLSQFTARELIWMKNNLTEVNKLYSNAKFIANNLPVLEAARAKIKYKLSSNPNIIAFFSSIIAQKCDLAEIFLREWIQLVDSGKNMHQVEDENLSSYYLKMIDHFFDTNYESIMKKFNTTSTVADLFEYFKELSSKIIDSVDIFKAPFEEEIRVRLKNQGDAQNAKDYVRHKLTGEKLPICYLAQFSIGYPLISCIMTKSNTQLYDNLVHNLETEKYYFYNTGSSYAAEALNIYSITDDNLVTNREEG